MIYRIIENPEYTRSSKIGLELKPDNDPIKFFFSGLKIIGYPTLIDCALSSKGYGEEIAGGVIFFNDLTLEDFVNQSDFEKGNVKIFNPVHGETLIDEVLFLRILHDYATKLLEVYQMSSELSESWKSSMRELLVKLASKID